MKTAAPLFGSLVSIDRLLPGDLLSDGGDSVRLTVVDWGRGAHLHEGWLWLEITNPDGFSRVCWFPPGIQVRRVATAAGSVAA